MRTQRELVYKVIGCNVNINKPQGMSEKERLLTILHGKTPDRPSVICPGGMMNMTTEEFARTAKVSFPAAHSDPDEMVKLSRAAHDIGGFENLGVPFCMTVEAQSMGATVDLGSSVCEPHVVEGSLASVRDLSSFHDMDLTQGRAATVICAVQKLHALHSGIPVIANIVGPVSVAGTLVNMEVLLREMHKYPFETHAFVEKVTDNLIRYAHALIDAGADVICIAEPSGTGEILGPRLFSTYTIRYLNQLIDHIEGLPTIVHICGKLTAVLTVLDQIHADAFSFDATINAREVRTYVPDKVLMGNVSTFALKDANPDKVAKLAQGSLKAGVDILAPACGISMSTPTENIQAMTKTARAYTR